MTFRHIALKNVWGNRRSYTAYVLSGIVMVCVFYMFAAFVFHPDVLKGNIRGAQYVQQGLEAAQFIIVAFALTFLLYSQSHFFRARTQEFGIYALFGMTPGQLARLMVYEQVLLSLVIISFGTLFGVLFSKLFLLALSVFLEVEPPIAFRLVPRALLITVGGFFLLYQVVNLYTVYRVLRLNIIEQLKESRKPRLYPALSRWKTAIGLLCIGGGYGLAYRADALTMIPWFVPIVGLVVTGTFLLFSQGSVFILDKLKRSPVVYAKGTWLLTLSQLIYRMKDNARMLAITSVLMTVVLSASGTLIVFYFNLKEEIVDHNPQTITVYERGLHSSEVVDREALKRVLLEHGAIIDREEVMVGIPVPFDFPGLPERTGMIVSNSAYNEHTHKMKDIDEITIEQGHVAFVYPYQEVQMKMVNEGETYTFDIGNQTVELVMADQLFGAVTTPKYAATFLFVVHDEDFEQLRRLVNDDELFVVYGYELANWEESLDAVKAAEALVEEDKDKYFSQRVESYVNMKASSMLTLFIGSFISVLFFIATLSILYFKLFTEYQHDQQHYEQLRRIGLSDQDFNRITALQMIVIFFLPFAVGVLHALFAFKTLSNVLASNVYIGLMWVVAGFLVFQIIYFFLARRLYRYQLARH
ncbi:protein of unknown function DUF214 [Caldalkalibacillus thermarum TA2.A1]|uniref:ABC transporter permease n=1 Tax=Caldalkalibacillus thermarum (strain TA2.A1) TaxID=986075 RepID=F5L7W2_CALTT|nr:ABC transporter permease [Caldalkalibacillus thermarum]EGL82550.1 protein of unknown function DUF214 [Caldalkalibacillus thermarum TA2.A1]QZT34797.1 ABC transporter permease [Caldalkalibacillus thermarum TA2.A1]